jgi:hypothetical protein
MLTVLLTRALLSLCPQASLDEVEQVLFDAHHCPSWFTADNRLGQLCITLEPPDCFNAEEYAAVRGGLQCFSCP